MFELFVCISIAVLIFGLIFYQNYAEKQRMRRLMRRKPTQPADPPA